MKMNWFILALIAMISFTILFLILKKIADFGINSAVIYFYTSILAALVALIYIFGSNLRLNVNTYSLFLLIIVGIIAFIGNVFLIESLKVAPNPGYSLAVIAMNNVLVAIISVFVFKSEITLIKGFGILLAIIGTILLGL